MADFLCLQHQKESLPDIRRGFCAIGFIGFRPGIVSGYGVQKHGCFFLMQGQGGYRQAADSVMDELVIMYLFFLCVGRIIQKIVGKGVQHTVTENGGRTFLGKAVLLPENGINHVIPDSLAHILQFHIRCKAAHLAQKLFYFVLKSIQCLRGKSISDSKHRFGEKEAVEQAFRFL